MAAVSGNMSPFQVAVQDSGIMIDVSIFCFVNYAISYQITVVFEAGFMTLNYELILEASVC